MERCKHTATRAPILMPYTTVIFIISRPWVRSQHDWGCSLLKSKSRGKGLHARKMNCRTLLVSLEKNLGNLCTKRALLFAKRKIWYKQCPTEGGKATVLHQVEVMLMNFLSEGNGFNAIALIVGNDSVWHNSWWKHGLVVYPIRWSWDTRNSHFVIQRKESKGFARRE